MDYILSPCRFAAEGLARMMTPGSPHLVQLNSRSLTLSSLPC